MQVINLLDGTTFEHSLVGSWIMVNPFANGIPVYQFDKEQLHYFNFKTYSHSVLYDRHEDQICVPNDCFEYKFLYENRFSLYFRDLFDPFMPIREDFLRIVPTESDIPFEELATKTLYAESETYDLDTVIELQPPYPEDGTKRLDGSYDEMETVYRLEVINDCWLITRFYNGYREVCYPIWFIEDETVQILGVDTEEILAEPLTME